ncbi:MAG: DUF465 domain-containing protein [Gammaproteobacteria bacterium]|nr:DUF465 domain-containing protein [Gammaproteobacteria bacterium]
MQLTTHPLIEEFPEYKDQIHTLKMDNSHFRRLAHEYEGIDKSIVRAEQGLEIVNDDYLSEIKKERLHLKDLIFKMIKNQ